jgi:hypothetical protein
VTNHAIVNLGQTAGAVCGQADPGNGASGAGSSEEEAPS